MYANITVSLDLSTTFEVSTGKCHRIGYINLFMLFIYTSVLVPIEAHNLNSNMFLEGGKQSTWWKPTQTYELHTDVIPG